MAIPYVAQKLGNIIFVLILTSFGFFLTRDRDHYTTVRTVDFLIRKRDLCLQYSRSSKRIGQINKKS